MICGWFLQKNIPKQKSPLILRQNDSGPGCKERPLWSSGQKCIIWEHSWPIWPCNLIHVPVCQLAEHRAQNRSFSCSFTALFSLCDTLSSLFFFFSSLLISFYFVLLMLGFLAGSALLKIWQLGLVSHMDFGASSGRSAHLMVVWSWPFLKTNQNKCLLFCVWYIGAQ